VGSFVCAVCVCVYVGVFECVCVGHVWVFVCVGVGVSRCVCLGVCGYGYGCVSVCGCVLLGCVSVRV
jgi:hypothetical protein